MQILKLRLKNFKGILFGSLGKDEVEIDLSTLPNGIIAIHGPNGAGKTTILDCLHPYRSMPFRANQSLVDAVYDIGVKEIYFQTSDKNIYYSKLLINSKSREMECFLYRQSGNNWETIVDGRAEEYDREIQRILIPEDLFFLSAFRAQNAKSFVNVKKTELKKLFEDLLGLEHYSKKAKNAEIKRKEIEEEIRVRVKEIEGINATISSIDIRYPDKNEWDKLQEEKSNIEKKIAFFEKEIIHLKTLEASLEERLKNINGLIKSKESDVFNRKKTLTQRIEFLNNKIKNYNSVLAQKNEILNAIGMLSKVTDELTKINSEIENIRKGIEQRAVLLEEKANLGNKLSHFNSELRAYYEKRKVAQKNAQILDEVPCGDKEKQSCKLLSNALQDKKKIPEIEDYIKSLENQIADIQSKINLIVNQINTLPSTIPTELLQKEAQLKKKIDSLQSIASKKDVLFIAEKEIISLNSELESVQKELLSIDELIKDEIKQLNKEKEDILEKIEPLKIDIGYIEGEITKLKENLSAISKKIEEFIALESAAIEKEKTKKQLQAKIETLEKELIPLRKDLEQWRVIEKAFGKDGMMAYDLETAAPVVSSIANLLLDEMGGRFAIRFETLRPKVGKKNEYIEVFDIKVLDIVGGIEKSLVDLSGGELVWIDEAIARAINIYLQRSTGSKILTVYSDERDGNLDKDKKIEYVNMKRKVLAEGGYLQEFFISHTPEVIDLADAVITISKDISIDIRNSNSVSVNDFLKNYDNNRNTNNNVIKSKVVKKTAKKDEKESKNFLSINNNMGTQMNMLF